MCDLMFGFGVFGFGVIGKVGGYCCYDVGFVVVVYGDDEGKVVFCDIGGV